jgi:hypothetical protein
MAVHFYEKHTFLDGSSVLLSLSEFVVCLHYELCSEDRLKKW